MISKIKNRLASEQGFTLIELLVVIVILGILVAIAVPSYLSFRGKAETASAEANVRSAIPAAESWTQDSANNGAAPLYTGLDAANLAVEAPGVSPSVHAVAVNSGKGYCIDATSDSVTYYDYIGGDPGGALVSPAKVATIQQGDCATDVGTAST